MIKPGILFLLAAAGLQSSASAFEGRIDVILTQGAESTSMLYTVGATQLRIEVTDSTAPNAVDILDLKSGTMTLLFPNNHSYVRFTPAREASAAPGAPGMPMPPGGLPPGIGPQSSTSTAMPPMPGGGLPPGIGPQSSTSGGMPASMPGMPGMSGMPQMHMGMPGREKLELKPTGKKDNILDCACQQYELKQHGETLEIWATDQLLPFQPYLASQPHRFLPQMIEEQWPKLVTERKLFPLRAILRYDNGAERFRFEVKSVKAEKLKPEDASLFEPPADYAEIQPLPF